MAGCLFPSVTGSGCLCPNTQVLLPIPTLAWSCAQPVCHHLRVGDKGRAHGMPWRLSACVARGSIESLHGLCSSCFQLPKVRSFGTEEILRTLCTVWSRLAWGCWKRAVRSGCSHLSLSMPRLCRENCYLLHLEDLCRFAILFIRLDNSFCTGFLASGKLTKLAVYSGAESLSGETLIHGIFLKLWFESAVLVTLARGIVRHWKFSYLDKEKSCFSHVLCASSLLSTVFHSSATFTSSR